MVLKARVNELPAPDNGLSMFCIVLVINEELCVEEGITGEIKQLEGFLPWALERQYLVSEKRGFLAISVFGYVPSMWKSYGEHVYES